MKPIVSVENLNLTIGDRQILKDVSFEVYEGEVFTVLGGSGSGKTTITKCIVSLLKPTSGKVKVFGKDVSSLSQIELDEMRKKIGYVFQGAALFDSLTVWENVVFYYLEHGNYSKEELRSTALKYLNMVGLSEESLDLYPSELSGGMRKRVGIARAIATEPELLIYDEPTSGLDPITSRLIDELIVSLRKKTSSTAIVVSHDLVSAFSISDRIMIIKEGQVAQIGTKEEIMNSQIPFVREFIDKGLGEVHELRRG
ncbi:ABC transporter ATP-binding protein [Hydrogenobacter sp. T-2]|uniref:ABC transporter ATP-binding protein n=1 Tax=Pampinifervens diazotrophicum TaxID=1632018 RepID=UPI002B264600|nr:ABC transporter ATP-binding protein [Hydrogenobacter sp. T-2]WPM32950.1 ABC transporter ATP-binding protein [Hydrogenobacter sp. T-2]